MKQLIFSDLIEVLKTVKKPQDINEDVLAELVTATSTAYISEILQQDKDCSLNEAIEIARASVLKHFDFLILDQHNTSSLN